MANSIAVIPKKLAQKDDLVVVPRRQYLSLLQASKSVQKRLLEEKDTDEAIAVYLKEKKMGKLRVLKSLSDLR